MPDSYQLQNRSGRNMMKTCGLKITIFFKPQQKLQ